MSDESEIKIDRRIIFSLIGTLITVLIASGSGFFVMYGDVISTKAEVKSIDKRVTKGEKVQSDLSKSMVSIDKGVAVLVKMADVRNDLLVEKNKRQEEYNKEIVLMRKEQVDRMPRINWVDKQMLRGR